jgi:hypothetical protein
MIGDGRKDGSGCGRRASSFDLPLGKGYLTMLLSIRNNHE